MSGSGAADETRMLSPAVAENRVTFPNIEKTPLKPVPNIDEAPISIFAMLDCLVLPPDS
jgi:hypothetical protein